MRKKILVVDDNAINRLMLSETLSGIYDVLEAENGRVALDKIRSSGDTFSAVLLDIFMPEMDGYEVLQAMRNDPELSRLPVIMVTGSDDEAARVKAVSLGASDFIHKPFNPEIVRHCLANNITLSETSSMLRAVQWDSLTGLYTRDAFFRKAEELIQAGKPGDYILSRFDIDSFKVINDQYGTEVGDNVLRHIADTARGHIAEVGGICCRLDSDDFAWLMPSATVDPVALQAVHHDMTHPPFLNRVIGISIGRCLVDDLQLPVSAILDRATLAQLSVKGKYGQYVRQYDESMRQQLLFEQELVSQMDNALKGRQFEVWFQPQRNHIAGTLIGAEALVRWRHPERGLIPPVHFIPVFEQNGFVYELDKYVWEESCRYLRKWADEGRDPLPVSVNVSRYDILQPDVIDVLTELVRRYSVPTSLLRLEITESAFAQATQVIVSKVKDLVACGFTVEIDDFGSGYSSLNTLKNVPAQVIKLDMRFLDDDDGSGRGGNILESVVRMIRWLGMSTIAEGVEDKAQADYLSSIGCSYIQGYLYAKPMPAPDYEKYCRGIGQERRLLSIEAVANLNNNLFWDPHSMDSLIFNSYVGAACVFEMDGDTLEMLRVSEKYPAIFSDSMTVETALKLDWHTYLSTEDAGRLLDALRLAGETGQEHDGEYMFHGVPGCHENIYLRSSMRVIAKSRERMLIYCVSTNITAQREAEQKERDAMNRLQIVMSNIDSSVQVSAFDGDTPHVMFANDRYYEHLGYTREQYELDRPDPFLFIHPDDRQRVVEMTLRANAEQLPYSVIYRCIRRDGLIFWRRSNVRFIRFPGADKPVQLSVSSDITALKNAEWENSAVSSQLQAVLDNIGCGITAVTYDGDRINCLLINDGYYEILGYTREQYGEGLDFSHIHDEDRERVADVSRNAYIDGLPVTIEFRALRRDGSVVWLRDSITRTNFAGVDVPVQLSIFSDITTQRTAMQELLDNLPGGAGLFEFDGESLYAIYISKRYWEFVGRPPMNRSGESVLPNVHPDDRAMVLKQFNTAIQRGTGATFDFRILYGESEYRLLHLRAEFIRKDERRYSVYGSFATVTSEEQTIRETLPVALQAVMDASSDIAYVKDRHLRYLSCSRQFLRLTGRSSVTELLGQSSSDVFPAELAEQYNASDRKVLDSGASLVDYHTIFPTESGTRQLLFSKYPLLDANGNILGIYGAGRDVTEAQQVSSRLEMLTNSIPGGIASFEGDLNRLDTVKLTYFSDGLCRLLEYSRDEYTKLSSAAPLGHIDPEDVSLILDRIRQLTVASAPLDIDCRVTTKSGRRKWLNIRAVMGEPSGNLSIVNAAFFDVTEQRTALDNYRISEEEKMLAIRHSNRLVCRYEVPTRKLTLMHNTHAILGDETVFEDVPYSLVRSGRISPATADAYTGFYESILRGEKSGSVVFQRGSASDWRWFEGQFSTIFSGDGKPAVAIITLLDVTDARERDAAYHRWQQSLSDRVPETYSVFRANISRNTTFDATQGKLLSIIDNGDVIQTFDGRSAAYSKQRVYSADRDKYLSFLAADNLLAEFLSGKRSAYLDYRETLPGGEYRWLRVSVELTEYADGPDVEAYLLFEDIDAEKRAELEILERAETDPLTGVLNRATFTKKVDEVLAASGANARHALLMLDIDGFKLVNDVFGHGAGDQALIDVAEALQEKTRQSDFVGRLGGDEFVVFFSGISADDAAKKAQHICERTRKTFSADVRISGSVGIALYPGDGLSFDALYKKADETLYRVKDAGKDSFAFYSDDPATGGAAAASPSPSGPVPGRKKRRMLIVDDNRVDYELLASIFAEDYKVEKASGGAEALVKLRHFSSAISIVLLDLVMPGMDGFEVLAKMQQHAEMSAIPVIVVSGDESSETNIRAIRAGASDFVIKPVNPDLLRTRVSSAVSKAENERLRAQNSVLSMQSAELSAYRTALEHSGIAVIASDWGTGRFSYPPSTPQLLAGTYDDRALWHIFLSDAVADPATVKQLQRLTHDIANDRGRSEGSMTAQLKTPTGERRTFTVSIYKQANSFGLTDKLILTFRETGQ